MICLEVSINGEKPCIAGIAAPSTVEAQVTCQLDLGGEDPEDLPAKLIILTVTGASEVLQEVVSWPRAILKVGDQVSIRVIECSTIDEPVKRDNTSMKDLANRERALYERLKLKFESTPPEPPM